MESIAYDVSFLGNIEFLDWLEIIPLSMNVMNYIDYLHDLHKSSCNDFPILPNLMVRSALSPYTIEPLNHQVFNECQQFLLKRLINFFQNVDSLMM